METDKGKIVSGKANRTEHHEYAVRFGLDGRYKSKTMLPAGKLYLKVAVLPSGEMLLLSYNKVNRAPALQVLDSDGKQMNSILLQGGLPDDAAIDRGRSGDAVDSARASMSVSAWQFIPARGKVLLYRPNGNAPILEIGNGGTEREVPIEGPPGYKLESFVPSTKHWFAIFRRSGLGDNGSAVDSSASGKNFLIAELNPSDGSVERLFEMDRGSFFDIACEVDGQFIGYSVDDPSSKFLLSCTDAPNKVSGGVNWYFWFVLSPASKSRPGAPIFGTTTRAQRPSRRKSKGETLRNRSLFREFRAQLFQHGFGLRVAWVQAVGMLQNRQRSSIVAQHVERCTQHHHRRIRIRAQRHRPLQGSARFLVALQAEVGQPQVMPGFIRIRIQLRGTLQWIERLFKGSAIAV